MLYNITILDCNLSEMPLQIMIDLCLTVFEIKGAPCARCAHFRQRAHIFLSCAPGVCTIFQSIIMAKY